MKNFKFFSGNSNLPLASKVANDLGIKLAEREIHHFSNNETRVRVEEDVKGKTCFLLQSLSSPTDEYLVETLLFMDALKRGGAKKIIGIIPWLGYQKQDKQFRNGEAISVAVVIKTLETMGMGEMITFDLHSKLVESYFQDPPTVLSAFPIFLEKIRKLVAKDGEKFVMVAPDNGAYWEIEFSHRLKIPLAKVTKERDRQTAKIPFCSLKIYGQVEGKTAIIVDDNIYTGSTIIHNAKFLRMKGAKRVICFVTHPILSGNAPQLIQDSQVDSLTVTDTIFVPPEKRIQKLSVLSVASLLASEIKKRVE